jgi:hypothetical protein
LVFEVVFAESLRILCLLSFEPLLPVGLHRDLADFSSSSTLPVIENTGMKQNLSRKHAYPDKKFSTEAKMFCLYQSSSDVGCLSLQSL